MIESRHHGDIVEILLDNPPVNALGKGLREELMAALKAAEQDSTLRAIVLRGAGRLFSGGADIAEFGKPIALPQLPEIVDMIEACSKPVIAAIHGLALGGGLELALGCHYRLATPGARLGLPEVKLGLLPGAGGTQRLPRIIGVEKALDVIISGNPISGEQAREWGLVDALFEEADLAEQAIGYARQVVGVRRTADMTVEADADLFERFAEENKRSIGKLDAPRACIEAVRAATQLPVKQGLLRERELFDALMAGDQSRALRHAFFAERAAAKVDDIPEGTMARPIKRVGIIGAGTMGGGIGMNFLSAGIPVTIVEMRQDALDRGIAVIRRNYEATAAKGRISQADVETAMNLLTPTLDFDSLAQCDLIIEAVYEQMEVKKEIFTRLDAIARPGAILASNTSYLDIDEIASVTSRPADVLGMHFFSPANVMRLLEIVRGEKTADDVLTTAVAIAKKIGKAPVVVGVCYGFVGNRMLEERQSQATQLVLEGASPEQIDRIHTEFGMPMGPFQMADLAGVDIGWHRDETRVETIREALCAAGRWGQKTRAGYYDYDDRRRPTPSPVTARIIEEFRAAANIEPREISEQEIIARTLYTMVNEGAIILEEKIAQRPSDIDVVWLYGYGWPRHTGGIMYWAETVGFANIAAGLSQHIDKLPPDFRLASLLRAESPAPAASSGSS